MAVGYLWAVIVIIALLMGGGLFAEWWLRRTPCVTERIRRRTYRCRVHRTEWVGDGRCPYLNENGEKA